MTNGVQNGSRLRVQGGSKLRVQNGSRLRVQGGSRLRVQGGSKLRVQGGSRLCVADLSLVTGHQSQVTFSDFLSRVERSKSQAKPGAVFHTACFSWNPDF